jgi:hypothetical protein
MIGKFLKSLVYLLAGLCFLLIVWCVYLLLAAGTAPAPEDHLRRKGTLSEVRQTDEYRRPGGLVREFRLQSDSGLAVDIAVLYPDQSLPHHPLLLMMGGQETGRAAVSVIPDTLGVTLAAISYPFGVVPHRDLLGMLLSLRRIQAGIFDTPAAALLALDYLLSPEAGLSPGRVELAGVSFGAYLAAVPAALDTRVQRLWLIHGGGDPQLALDHMLRKRIGQSGVREQVARFLAAVAGAAYLGPERWVQRLAPRPLVLVHARADDDLPPAAIDALHGAVREPVEILWTPGQHVHPKRPEVVEAISRLLFSRISAAGPGLAR